MFSFFFFKQKTAYEMRISDWSSYVCSADLAVAQFMLQPHAEEAAVRRGVEAFAEIRTYVEAQIDDRLSTGSTDDVLGLLAAAKDREGLSLDEITATAMQLVRSEEHTSELQSLMRISYAVFCLKKQTTKTATHTAQRHKCKT